MSIRVMLATGFFLGSCNPASAQNVAGIINPAQISGGVDGARLEAQAFQASDVIPVRALQSDWQGTFQTKSGSIAWGIAQVRAGFTREGWEVDGLWRGQALIQASPDAWSLTKKYQKREDFEANKTYALNYKLSGFEADGIRLGKRSNPIALGNGDFRWAGGVSALRGRRLKIESALGQAITLGARDVDLSITHSITGTMLNTKDSSQFNPFVIEPGGVSGQGFAVDFGLEWRSTSGLVVGVAINDALGEIQWKNVPSRVASTASVAKTYDSQGYVTFLPGITAQSQYGSIRQVLPLRWALTLEHPLSSRISVLGGWNQVDDFSMPEIGFRLRSDKLGVWRFDYESRFHTLGIAFAKGIWSAGIRTEDVDLTRSSGYGVKLGFAIQY